MTDHRLIQDIQMFD